VLAGREPARLRRPAVLGRLAELHLRDGGQGAGRARQLAEAGLALVSGGDPILPKLLHVMAMALRAGDPPPGALGRDGRAARADRDAWLLSLDPVPREALHFAREWGDWAWRREAWDEAAEAYEAAAIALHRIVLRATPGIRARLDLLGQHRHLGPRSAFAHARAGRPREAVTVLERDGDLLFAAGSQRRDLDALALDGRSDLRDAILRAAGESAGAAAAPPDGHGWLAPAARSAQRKVDELVRHVRALPGRSRFATPAGWADVCDAARHLPFAYLAATDKGTVVLTVRQGAGQIAYACLPQTLQDAWLAVREFFRGEHEIAPASSADALLRALEWLSLLVLPVYRALDGDHPVVLVPSGLLAQLPLHAACGIFAGKRIRYWFHPSHVTYAGSARSWLACRERARAAPARALVVSNPGPLPATHDELLLSDYEAAAVARHLPVTVLAGREATDEAILDALPRADVAHLSCHGAVDGRFRYTGVLLVADRRVLTIAHWEGSPALRARLVFLSACGSGMTASGVAQLVSVPAALVAAGAAAVIGTLWHADEMATLLVVTRFYHLWGGGAELAAALGGAQEWLALSSAADLRRAVPGEAAASPAASRLAACPDDERPYGHPWFWAPFFLLGA